MHEVGLIQDALDRAVDTAERAGARRIEEVRFVISTEGHLTATIVRDLFQALSAGTIAASARVEVETRPIERRCLACGAGFGTDKTGARAIRPPGATRDESGEDPSGTDDIAQADSLSPLGEGQGEGVSTLVARDTTVDSATPVCGSCGAPVIAMAPDSELILESITIPDTEEATTCV